MNDIIRTITEYILSFLELSSWRMYQPHILGLVHSYGFVITVSAAVFFAIIARNKSEKEKLHLITCLGWVLLFMEIYKQLFYYYIVNDRVFDWWLFPFQLCSIPMYLCILLPFMKSRGHHLTKSSSSAGFASDVLSPKAVFSRETFLTFMAGFTFVSALAALIYPEDMLRPYVTLTVHGFLWHGILLFISVLIGISGMADLSLSGFMRSVVLFLMLAVIAILINVLAEPLAAASSIEGSYPNMFYLSPYHLSNQPFVDKVETAYGRPIAMAAYTAGIIVLAGAADLIFKVFSLLYSRAN